MSAYINLETKEYPLYQGDIRLSHPEIGEEFILPEGYAVVHPVEIPTLEKLQYYVETAPIEIDGRWTMQLEIKERTQEEYDYLLKMTFGKSEDNEVDLNTTSGNEPDVIG